MGGYIYKYINNDSGDVVYVGKSINQITLINRLSSHAKKDSWSVNTSVEFAEVPYDVDLDKAETAAINYYYINKSMTNIQKVGDMSKPDARKFLRNMSLVWVPIDIDDLLPTDTIPKPGGLVCQLEHGVLMGMFIITQVIYTNRGAVYRLFSTDFASKPREEITFANLVGTGKYHYWTPELFNKLCKKYRWDDVDY